MIRLAGCHTVTGRRVDVDVDPESGLIAAVGRAGAVPAAPGDEVLDLAGYLVLPAPAEPHAHLDKALVGERVRNPTGDLAGAILSWQAQRPTLTFEDIVERARRAALMSLAAGATAIRTHVDVVADVGVRGVEALACVRDELAGVLDLQVVALAGPPLCGPAGSAGRALLARAIEAGADIVGGAPHVEPDTRGETEACIDAALDAGVGIDLHTDETLEVTKLGLLDLVEGARRRDLAGPVAASHCVSLGAQDVDVQVRIARVVAEAGVAVIANPPTNLYLQGRDRPVSTPRGLAALRPLLDAGVTVAAGGDNVRDPFNPLGRGDPLETAALLVIAGHLDVETAWEAVSSGARAALGLPPVAVAAGSPAELLAVRAGSLADAIASATEDRVVVHRGRVVARTTVTRELVLSGGQQERVATR
jgi:cytosine deaminase